MRCSARTVVPQFTRLLISCLLVICLVINKGKSPTPECNKCCLNKWMVFCMKVVLLTPCSMNIRWFMIEKFELFVSSLFCWTSGVVTWASGVSLQASSVCERRLVYRMPSAFEASVFGCMCKGRLWWYMCICVVYQLVEAAAARVTMQCVYTTYFPI